MESSRSGAGCAADAGHRFDPRGKGRMISGGCRCGATRYTLAVDVIPPVYCCHCLDCQSWSGSAFSEQAVVRTDALSITGP
ncbi:GFA family protein, partial [Staphylococcus aureus]